MRLPAALIAPLALLCIGAAPVAMAGKSEDVGSVEAGRAGLADQPRTETLAPGPASSFPFSWLAEAWRPDGAGQVSIEQHITIRITPRSSGNPDPRIAMFSDQPERMTRTRVAERSMAKCLPIDGIAAVQVAPANRLVLYLRDTRVVSTALGKGCNAADYYSGFYVARSADGLMCVGRDKLQSRNGASCKLGKMKQLVQAGD